MTLNNKYSPYKVGKIKTYGRPVKEVEFLIEKQPVQLFLDLGLSQASEEISKAIGNIDGAKIVDEDDENVKSIHSKIPKEWNINKATIARGIAECGLDRAQEIVEYCIGFIKSNDVPKKNGLFATAFKEKWGVLSTDQREQKERHRKQMQHNEERERANKIIDDIHIAVNKDRAAKTRKYEAGLSDSDRENLLEEFKKQFLADPNNKWALEAYNTSGWDKTWEKISFPVFIRRKACGDDIEAFRAYAKEHGQDYDALKALTD